MTSLVIKNMEHRVTVIPRLVKVYSNMEYKKYRDDSNLEVIVRRSDSTVSIGNKLKFNFKLLYTIKGTK